MFLQYLKQKDHNYFKYYLVIILVIAPLFATIGNPIILNNGVIEFVTEKKVDLRRERSEIKHISPDEAADMKYDSDKLRKQIDQQLSEADLEMDVDLLPSEKEKITIYSKPDKNSTKVGYFQYPATVNLIRLDGNFAKVRVGDGAGWISKRSILSENFKKEYQSKLTGALLGLEKKNGYERFYYYKKSNRKDNKKWGYLLGLGLIAVGANNLNSAAAYVENQGSTLFYNTQYLASLAGVLTGGYITYKTHTQKDDDLQYILHKKDVNSLPTKSVPEIQNNLTNVLSFSEQGQKVQLRYSGRELAVQLVPEKELIKATMILDGVYISLTETNALLWQAKYSAEKELSGVKKVKVYCQTKEDLQLIGIIKTIDF